MSPHGYLLEGCGDWRPYDRNMPACRAGFEAKSAKGRVDGSLVGQKVRKTDEPGYGGVRYWCQQSESETSQRGRRLTGFRSRSRPHPAMTLISSWFSKAGRSMVILARVLAVISPAAPGNIDRVRRGSVRRETGRPRGLREGSWNQRLAADGEKNRRRKKNWAHRAENGKSRTGCFVVRARMYVVDNDMASRRLGSGIYLISVT